MYVLEVSGSAALTGIDKAANGIVYVPADRCTWTTGADTDGGYEVTAANFYPGNAAAVAIDGTNLDLRFGFIGKTGRFVAMTN